MALVLGLDCKLYVNTDESYVSPVWSELTNCRDVTLTMEKNDADVTTRGNNGWRARVGVLKDATLEFDMVWDTDDPNFDVIRDAYLNNEAVEMAALDGDVETTGSQGLRGEWTVTNFSRNENLEEAVTVSVSLALTYAPDNPPQWMEVA